MVPAASARNGGSRNVARGDEAGGRHARANAGSQARRHLRQLFGTILEYGADGPARETQGDGRQSCV